MDAERKRIYRISFQKWHDGYKMVVMDLTKGMKQMEEMEQKWKTAEDQMKGLQGKSAEELLQMLKNK